MTAIILEDELMASNRLTRMLLEIDSKMLVLKVFTSIQETVAYLSKHAHPDILFADIHVADGNSFELLKLVKLQSKLIFTTAFDEYAVQAFRENAVDYLLKPIKKKQLIESINRSFQLVKEEQKGESISGFKDRFLIKFGMKLRSVKTEDIAYIYSKNKISYFYTFDGVRVPSDFKLQDLEEELDPKIFMRANRQFIIHIDSINDMTRYDSSRLKLSLNPPIEVDVVVSTERTRVFKKWIDR